TPEAIYTTYPASVLSPSSIAYTANDSTLYGVLANPLGIVSDLTISKPATPPTPLDQASVDAILDAAATDDDFVWNGSRLTAKPGVEFGPNRLILLMSDTMGYPSTGDPATTGGYTGWSDVQLFELTAGGGNGLQWNLPLDVNLTDQVNPPIGAPTSAQVPYTLSRSTFFVSATVPDVATTNQYPAVHVPTITPKAGTYERWYVANVGNPQPLVASGPDMHPFHSHLVNFVVLRHWKLVGDSFELVPPAPMDGSARQDTLLVPSDSLYEILLYFPPGYSGTYVYHCHILEHEDKCMMSTFTVS
ncbi:MAG: multicopper oxidase domain-containing protein, partial [Steroidobacteraceae bacterium]